MPDENIYAHLGEGREAVGGARCIGNDGGGGVECVTVDSDDVCGDVIALGRGSDEHLQSQTQ